MSKVTVSDIKTFVIGALGRSTGVKHHRVFLVQDKKTLIEMVKCCDSSTAKISQALSTLSHYDSEAKWVGRINTWSAYHRQGRLNTENAVAIQKPRQEEPVKLMTGSRLKAVVREYLGYGMKEEEILRIVGSECLQHEKRKVIKEMKDYMTARGLTIQDLQQSA